PGGKPVMPFVEPFRSEPFSRAFVLGTGVRARSRHAARKIRRSYDQSAQRGHSRWSRLPAKVKLPDETDAFHDEMCSERRDALDGRLQGRGGWRRPRKAHDAGHLPAVALS